MELYIIRHAQSTNNALSDMRHRVQDPLLTEIAHEQAKLVADYVANGSSEGGATTHSNEGTNSEVRRGFGITKLYCSAMWRAMQTARPISEAIGLAPEVWVDIHEQGGIFLDHHDGQGPVGYSGKTRSEILAEFPDYILPEEVTEEGWWNKGYEKWPGCHARAMKVARKLISWSHSDDWANERIAMVSHGGFIDSLLKALILGLPEESRFFYHHNNTAVTRLDFHSSGRLGIRYINRLDHLTDNLVT